MYCRITSETWLVIFGTLLAILLRTCTNLHPYSGQSKPPMYGDYEAQRHWMEITTNLPLNQWYRNGTANDLNYWGLDYPPLTAYHMYSCGLIADRLNYNYTKLLDSRGYESENHKAFMRLTVLVPDVLIYIPALVLYYYTCIKPDGIDSSVRKKKRSLDSKPMNVSLSAVLGLLYPGLILIDHGHFQYNCVSLGLAVLSVIFIQKSYNLLASVAFCLALNYKQMELYHALPFFFYLLSTSVPKPGQKPIRGLLRLSAIGFTVIATFALIWAPFLFDPNDALQVLYRLFPVNRGVFEDKVSNVWCALNVAFKFKSKLDNVRMMRACLFCTVAALLPSCVDLFLRPNKDKFVLALINSSLAFFLCSFQVHEKSILLVAVPVLLYFPYDPFACYWFLCVSVFSMTPLLVKDDLAVALVALTLFYCVTFRVSVEHYYRGSLNNRDGLKEYYRSLLHTMLDLEYKKGFFKASLRQIFENSDALRSLLFHCCMLCSLAGCLALFVVHLVAKPPARYPDLYPLIISVYSCAHFVGFFAYFNVRQLKIPQRFDVMRTNDKKSL